MYLSSGIAKFVLKMKAVKRKTWYQCRFWQFQADNSADSGVCRRTECSKLAPVNTQMVRQANDHLVLEAGGWELNFSTQISATQRTVTGTKQQ